MRTCAEICCKYLAGYFKSAKGLLIPSSLPLRTKGISSLHKCSFPSSLFHSFFPGLLLLQPVFAKAFLLPLAFCLLQAPFPRNLLPQSPLLLPFLPILSLSNLGSTKASQGPVCLPPNCGTGSSNSSPNLYETSCPATKRSLQCNADSFKRYLALRLCKQSKLWWIQTSTRKLVPPPHGWFLHATHLMWIPACISTSCCAMRTPYWKASLSVFSIAHDQSAIHNATLALIQ